MSRFTDPNKWHKDKWFRKLKPIDKLVFLYLIDNCDIAGFWEKDIDMMAYSIGVDEEDIEGALEGLSKSIIIIDDWVWIKHFIRHQKNLPLNPKNNAHKGIIRILKAQSKRFNRSECYKKFLIDNDVKTKEIEGANEGLNSPTGKGKGKGKGNYKYKDNDFEVPSQTEVEEYFKDSEMIPEDVPLEAEKFINHYEDEDWTKNNGNRIKNWRRQAGTWKANYKKFNRERLEQFRAWKSGKVTGVANAQAYEVVND